MKIRKVIVLLILSNILFASYTIGQSNVVASATVNITIQKALQVNQIKGELSFGEIVQTDIATTVERSPKEGILFEVAGTAGRNVVVDYQQSYLENYSRDINSIISKKMIDFHPNVKTTYANSSYSNPRDVLNGASFELAEKNNSGVLYLWVGGEMNIDTNLPSGAYSGEFAITVSY